MAIVQYVIPFHCMYLYIVIIWFIAIGFMRSMLMANQYVISLLFGGLCPHSCPFPFSFL